MSHMDQSPVQTPPSPEVASRLVELQPIATLAKILQKVEAGKYPGKAEQYQHVASQLSRLLADAEPDEILYSILSAFPAAGELYENVRYAHAGLCLQDIDAAVKAETQAAELIKGVAQHQS